MTAEDEAIEDSSGPPPPSDAHEGDLQMTEGPPPVTMSVPATPAVNALLPPPSTPQPPAQTQQQPSLQLPLQQQTITTATNIRMDSPTFAKSTHQQTTHIHQRFGRSPSRGRVRQASRTPPPQRKSIAAQQTTPALPEQTMPALQDEQQPEAASAQQAALPSASDALDVAQQVSRQSAAPSILPATGISIDEQQQDTQPAEQQQSEETLFSPQEIAESPATVSIDSSPQVSPQQSQAGGAAPLLQPPSTEPQLSSQQPGQSSQLPEEEMTGFSTSTEASFWCIDDVWHQPPWRDWTLPPVAWWLTWDWNGPW